MPKQRMEYNYIELANVGNEGDISNVSWWKGDELPSRARRRVKKGQIISSDIFDPYVDDLDIYKANYEKFDETLASEMEAFALFYMAEKFNKKATCLLTVVDSPYDDRVVSSEDREKSLDAAITLALESLISY